MQKFISRALLGVVIGGGIALAGTSLAHADETSGDDGLLSGTQALLTVDLPITVAGNAISVIGDSTSSEATTEAPAQAAPVAAPVETSGIDSIGGGTQAIIDVAVPVTVGGNAVSVIGDSQSSDAATKVPEPAPAPAEPAPAPAAPATAPATTSGDESILSGTQVIAPITAPATIGGNAVSIIGDSITTNATTAPAGTQPTGTAPATTSGDESILGGTQAIAPIAIPVTIGGNAVSVIGDSTTTGATTAPAGTQPTGTAPATTTGDESILGGTQVIAPITAPVTIGGNAVSVIGDSETGGSTTVVPVTPVTPVVPVVPVTPVTPVVPTSPVTPTTPVTPVTLVPATASTTVASTRPVAASGTMTAAHLAQTGSAPLPLGWLAAMLAVGGLLLIARRTTSTSTNA